MGADASRVPSNQISTTANDNSRDVARDEVVTPPAPFVKQKVHVPYRQRTGIFNYLDYALNYNRQRPFSSTADSSSSQRSTSFDQNKNVSTSYQQSTTEIRTTNENAAHSISSMDTSPAKVKLLHVYFLSNFCFHGYRTLNINDVLFVTRKLINWILKNI